MTIGGLLFWRRTLRFSRRRDWPGAQAGSHFLFFPDFGIVLILGTVLLGPMGFSIPRFLLEGAADFYGPQALSMVFFCGHSASLAGSGRLVVFCSGEEI